MRGNALNSIAYFMEHTGSVSVCKLDEGTRGTLVPDLYHVEDI